MNLNLTQHLSVTYTMNLTQHVNLNNSLCLNGKST